MIRESPMRLKSLRVEGADDSRYPDSISDWLAELERVELGRRAEPDIPTGIKPPGVVESVGSIA